MRFFSLLARGAVIGFFLGKNALLWFVGWLALLLSFRGKAARQRWFAARLACLFRDLGATFVKVGQIMSTRPDILPPHIIVGLAKLQDDVGAFPYATVEKTITASLGKPPAEIFASFDREPVASASVAQVHAASLHDGRKVAVKVRRPGVVKIAEFDLTVMRGFARTIAVIPLVRLFAPVESVDQFGAAIAMQMDFLIEADNNRRFRENFKDLPEIDFPEIIDELCAVDVLTMTFIDGAKVLDAPKELGADGTRLATIGFQTLLKMVFEDGFVHADLHPGNIIVTKDGVVTLIDVGLTAELDDRHRREFAQFFASWAGGDGVTVAKLMHDLSPDTAVDDYQSYEADVVEFIGRYRHQSLGDVLVSEVVFDMMGILRRHRVRVNPTFTMCNIAIAVTEGIGRQLDDSLDLLGQAAPFFAALARRSMLLDPDGI